MRTDKSFGIVAAWILLFAVFPGSGLFASHELLRNGSFEQDADHNGVPDHWLAAGDSHLVSQSLVAAPGRSGGLSAKLTCTRFQSGSPAAHAMLCQLGVKVQQGRTYRLSFWAKGERIEAESVSVGLSDTRTWRSCGLRGTFLPLRTWRRFQFYFRAQRTCGPESRFQIWFRSKGTLWIDDASLIEVSEDVFRPGLVLPSGRTKNLIPNSSFECGEFGWGSIAADRIVHWGGGLNKLTGAVDESTACHGRSSLRIHLSSDDRPVSYFDYFDLYRTAVLAPLAGHEGYLPVEPGSPYTVSAYVKADPPGTPVLLAVQEFGGRRLEKRIKAGGSWKRFSFTFKPKSKYVFALVGPDLRSKREEKTSWSATVWIDAVQLERGDRPTPYCTRSAVEVAIGTNKEGNVFDLKEPFTVILRAANSGRVPAAISVDLSVTDFFDTQVASRTETLNVPAGGSIDRKVTFGPREKVRGFLLVRARGDGLVVGSPLRAAVIPAYNLGDSRFGVNHAYPWPHLLRLAKKAGILWVRDWSLKWQEVEPRSGAFDFSETDIQINRVLRAGLKVLALLPFPSSPWSSSAPARLRRGTGYEARRAVVAFAPKKLQDFVRYVKRTVEHYRDRILWFQVFNEPLFTSYSLPRREGYNAADYAKYVKAFRAACPRVRVLGGIGYLRSGQIMQDFELFFRSGGLSAVDAVDIHHYPKIRPPEFFESLLGDLRNLMSRYGAIKPVWLTEYAYYADDTPWKLPIEHKDFNQPLPGELEQAAFAVRWAVICAQGGVEKIFYHAGTCGTLNRDGLQGVLFKYAGRPKKIYAAQAVLSQFLNPEARFAGKPALPPSVKAYIFQDKNRSFMVLWTPESEIPFPLQATKKGVQLLDIVGRPINSRIFKPGPVPVYAVATGKPADFLRDAFKVTER